MTRTEIDSNVHVSDRAPAAFPGLGANSFTGKLKRSKYPMMLEAIDHEAPTRMLPYSFKETLVASQRINWRIEDIIGPDKTLDFTRPFMPEPLARVGRMDLLDEYEKLILNQIKGHAYLSIFGLVEEFILPFVLDHVRPSLDQDDYRVRAILQFASEEAKHIQLFKTFRKEFRRGFATECAVIGPAGAIARKILAYRPLAVALTVLQIEWMSQSHYVDSVKDDQQLDPQFKSLLKHHWLEEAQHAQLDTLMVEALAEGMSESEIEMSVTDYLEIIGFLDDGLWKQANFDMDAFERAVGYPLSEDGRAQFLSVQYQANRWTFIGSGMTHPRFLSTLYKLSPAQRSRVEDRAAIFR